MACLGEQFWSLRNDVFLDDMGAHSRGGASRARISQVADDEIVSWRERRVHAVFCFFAVNEILMCEVTGQPLLNQFANHC